ncbi:50S ribosomal protein L24 [Candidatus Curtissbacteria bacterium RBG_16_39_7]|uniref:Large ribosomal subunit protein uL24 n=1 Tax=Candidatus Curtissbacteria bacterium RBG_16_39_7 TaxID=1797707 RepID=A0A1F5G1P7_9BACT|nr:MAG: 50S ribosomal protein L24 [Candidatus Curtissbacteria bacterium RBG_16_39_7]
MLKLKKGDEVEVLIGKDKGRRGKIERVFPTQGRLIVGGINIYKRHKKARGVRNPGGIVDVARPLVISKVELVCPHCSKKTRVGIKQADGKKQRFCKKCKGEL